MDSINLKDFRPNDADLLTDQPDLEGGENQMAGSGFREEINTLKIDKLSNKVTIISIIIPVMIGAILVFAYLDMKERVFDIDKTKQSQVDQISRQFEEKLNALDVKIAKNRFDIENTLPGLKEKTVALDGQLAKLNNAKADKTTMDSQFSTLKQQVTANTNQNKTTVAFIEQTNKETLLNIKKNQDQFDKTAQQLKDEVTLFKEEFDARLLELSDYEQQIGVARKDISLLDKKYKHLEQEYLSKENFNAQIDQLKKELALQKAAYIHEITQMENKLIEDTAKLKTKIDQLIKSGAPVKNTDSSSVENKPTPQINIELPPPSGIKQKPLTQ
ncbi:MAG: hypothetical protein ABIJ31_02025 [Pseudomonadota bacterium]